MSLTFSEIQAMLLLETNRGKNPAVVSAIPSRINMVVSMLERNFNCAHMKRYEVFTLDPGMQWPRSIDIPGLLKSVRVIRRLSCCQTGKAMVVELTRVDPESAPPDRNDDILSYWVSGREKIWFDNTPQVLTRFDWVAQYYTGQITDPNATHFLFDMATDFIIGKGMQLMAPFMRDQEVAMLYKEMAQEGLQTFLTAEGALEDEGGRDDMMLYGEIYPDYARIR